MFALGTVMFLDGRMAQWPNCDTQLCHLLAVPPSSLYNVCCFDPADKPPKYGFPDIVIANAKTYELYAKTWVLMILIVNMVFFFTLCRRGQKGVKLAKKLSNYFAKGSVLIKLCTLGYKPESSLCEVLQTIPYTWSTFIFLWCIVEVILPNEFQVCQIRISFGIRVAPTSDAGLLNNVLNLVSNLGQREVTGSNSSFICNI